jgi:hypothetical protein
VRDALNAGDITQISVWTIVIVVVVGLLLCLLITKLIARVVIMIVVVAIAGYVWVQHNQIQKAIDKHKCSFTLAGVHLDPPDSLKKYC